MLQVAESIFNSVIRYGIALYLKPVFEVEDVKARSLSIEARRLQTIQNKMIRMIFGFRMEDKVNMEELREKIGMLSVNQMNCYHVLLEGREESGRQPSGIIGCPSLGLVAESGKRPCGIPWVQGGMWQAAMRQTLGSGWNVASGNAADPGFKVECGKRPCGRPCTMQRWHPPMSLMIVLASWLGLPVRVLLRALSHPVSILGPKILMISVLRAL